MIVAHRQADLFISGKSSIRRYQADTGRLVWIIRLKFQFPIVISTCKWCPFTSFKNKMPIQNITGRRMSHNLRRWFLAKILELLLKASHTCLLCHLVQPDLRLESQRLQPFPNSQRKRFYANLCLCATPRPRLRVEGLIASECRRTAVR